MIKFQIKNIKCKVTNIASTVETVNIRGEDVQMRLIAVHDNSAGMKIQCWNDQIDKVQKEVHTFFFLNYQPDFSMEKCY